MAKRYKLVMAIDIGASLTKVFARIIIDAVVHELAYTFASAVQRSNQSRYLAGQLGDDNTSLLEINGEYWMVGVAAKQAVLVTNVREAKNFCAVPKILSAVGQILSKFADLDCEKGEVELGILLPLDEVSKDPGLGDKITEHLFKFGHNGRVIQCGVVRGVNISPEGYGYTLMAEGRMAGILLFGHRDIAYLHIEKGSISLADSQALPGRGMVRLLAETNYPFKDELRAAAAIFAAGDGFRAESLLKLVPKSDVNKLQQALKESRQLIWAQLLDELASTSVRAHELIICGGGNSYYWKQELKTEFGGKISFCGNLLAEMQERFPELKKSPQLPRCADCYRFWLSLPGMNSTEQNKPVLAIVGGSKYAK